VTLREQGIKLKEMAKRVGLGVRTVQRWVSQDVSGETGYHHKHRSRFDAYETYVQQRWDEGCHTIQQLWREIRAHGYPHSATALRKHLKALSGKKNVDLEDGLLARPFFCQESRLALYALL